MQSLFHHTALPFRIGLPIQIVLPKTIIVKICMDSLKMAIVVLLSVLATLVMGF